MAGGEDRLIAWLAGFAGSGDRIGDDAVLLTLGERQYAFSVDTQRAGVHIPIDLDPADAARRLLAVSLSDLAATGAAPRWMLVALGIDDEDGARRFLTALVRAGRRFEVDLIGGDTARPTTPGRLDASLTVIGEIPKEGSPLTRAGARPDDRLWIGGPLGESALGLDLVRLGGRMAKRRAHLPAALPDGLTRVASRVLRRHQEPRPQLELGLLLGKRSPAGAAIDVSDGLAADAARLCRRSGVGCELEEGALGLRADARRLADHLSREPLELVLAGGEDYVLLFTLPPEVDFRRPGCRPIGRITTRPGLSLRRTDGTIERLTAGGWDHLSD
ncbi:MAG: thiamine-phosphate kinase [Acidobacteriota bacterium]|nr:thiamine-phosphate kinase [Acidobacteriota bacterium]MDE3263706.1 thiamine-phosphate kinase [Acidobacteriota bacterium]